MKNSSFAGSGTLVRFIFRRDRGRLTLWLVGLTGFIVLLVPVFEGLISSGGEQKVFAEMLKNPAMVAIVGPVYGAENYHVGAMFANMMLLFSAIIAGVMNIYLVARHTRQDEEAGRLEVIRSLPVGRLSNLMSTMVVAVLINTLLSVLVGTGLYVLRAEGMDLSGSMLFGAVLGVTGIFFAVATALFCQMSANNRTAIGLSMILLIGLYMLRAIGDMDKEIWSLISPLGLILRTKDFVENDWWPVGVLLLVSLIIGLTALVMARLRDLGQGLIPERGGRLHGGGMLSSPLGLSLKLIGLPLIIWMLIIFIVGGMYGSIFGDLESFISSNEILKAVFAANPEFSLTEQFISMLVAIVSMMAVIPALSFIHRIAGEEKRGCAEHILSKAVSKSEQMRAYFIPALLLSIVLQLLGAVGFWSVGTMVLPTAPSLGTFIIGAISYLPAIWVLMGISMVLVAYWPNKTYLSYIYLGYSFFMVYLGTIVDFPEWTRRLTPFGYVSQYPVEPIKAWPLVGLVFLAITLAIAGFLGYQKRDVQSQ